MSFTPHPFDSRVTFKVRAECLWHLTKTFYTEKITEDTCSQSAGPQQGCEQCGLPVGRGATRGHKSVYLTVMLLRGYFAYFSFFLRCRDWNFLLCRGCGKEEFQHHHQQLEGCQFMSHRHQQNCRLGCASGLSN